MEKVDHISWRYQPVAWFAMMLLLLVSVCAIAAPEDSRDPREFFFIQSFGDLPEELQAAGEQGKKGMLLFFEAEDCSYCKGMLKQVFSNKQVQDWYREHFLSMAVDIHGDVEIKDFDGITLPSKVFSDHRKVFVTPTVAFIDLHGSEIYRHVGMVKTPEEFLVLGEYIADGHYFDTEFSIFAEKKGLDKQESLVTPMNESTVHGAEK